MQTYFQQEGRVGARRDWVLSNPVTGQRLGCATSSWVMFNFKTRRLSKMSDDMRERYAQLMPVPPKHSIAEDQTKQKIPEVPEGTAAIAHTASPVHMDMNKHVNNTAYLTWILDSIPSDVQAQGVLAQYEVDYKAEGVAGARQRMHCVSQATARLRCSTFWPL